MKKMRKLYGLLIAIVLLSCNTSRHYIVWTFLLEQLVQQPKEIVANNDFIAAICNAKVFFDNYTNQQFNLDKKEIILSSGDNGLTPSMVSGTMKMGAYNAEKGQKFTPGSASEYYHTITPEKPHVFEAILMGGNATELKNLRRDGVLKVAEYFSNGRYTDYMGKQKQVLVIK